jgi:hypothetical protein
VGVAEDGNLLVGQFSKGMKVAGQFECNEVWGFDCLCISKN